MVRGEELNTNLDIFVKLASSRGLNREGTYNRAFAVYVYFWFPDWLLSDVFVNLFSM